MNVDAPIERSDHLGILPYVSEMDTASARWLFGCRIWVRAEATQTGGGLGLIELLVPPGKSSPYHVHLYEDVALYVLEGTIRVFAEGCSWVLGTSGFAFLPRGIPHGFRTEGEAPSRSLLIASPGGIEGFIAQLSSAEPPVGPPDVEALMTAAERGGMEILEKLPV